MKKNNFLKKVTSLILGVTMLMSLSVPSFADGAEGVSSIIDPSKTGSIEINKTATDGTTPVDGVEFSYVKVADIVQDTGLVQLKYDLTSAGRTIFSSLVNAENNGVLSSSVINDYMKNVGVSNVTYPSSQKGSTLNGKVKFSPLAVGVYLVEETNSANATVNGEKVEVSKGVGPFLVSVPQTNPDGNEWVYEVEVDAKNVIDNETITKTVEGDDVVITTDKDGNEAITAGIGSTMWYTVTGSASKVVEESIYTRYEIEDSITSALQYGEKGDNEVAFLSKIEVYLDGSDVSNKLAPADYRITTDKTTSGRIAGFNVALTASGLEKLNTVAKVDVTTLAIRYPVHMTENVLNFEAINRAKIKYTHKGGNPGEKETEVEVFPLGLEIEKRFDNISVEDLPPGTDIDATKVKFTIDKKGSPDTPIYVKLADSEKGIYVADLTVTTEGNGFSRFFNVSANGKVTVVGLPKGTYIVTEIVTVDGYSLLKEAIEVTLDKDKEVGRKMVPIADDKMFTASELMNLASDDGIGEGSMHKANSTFDVDFETNTMTNYTYVNGLKEDVANSRFEEKFPDIQTLIPGSIKIEKGTLYRVGNKTFFKDGVDVTNQFAGRITEEEHGYSINFGNISEEDQYWITYQSTINFEGKANYNVDISWYSGTSRYFRGIGTVIFVDYDKIKGTVKLNKVDAKNPDIKLPGAVFEVYKKGENTLLQTVTTNASGEIVFEKLPYGDYYLKEIVAPDGYILNESLIEFSINEDNYLNVQVINIPNNKDAIVDPPEEEREIPDISKIVINNEKSPAFELPSTGGMGTIIYTLSGILLMSAASLLYISLSKRNSFV